jgi:hypothetical protein
MPEKQRVFRTYLPPQKAIAEKSAAVELADQQAAFDALN